MQQNLMFCEKKTLFTDSYNKWAGHLLSFAVVFVAVIHRTTDMCNGLSTIKKLNQQVF